MIVDSFYLNETCYLLTDKLILVSRKRLIKKAYKIITPLSCPLDFDKKKKKKPAQYWKAVLMSLQRPSVFLSDDNVLNRICRTFKLFHADETNISAVISRPLCQTSFYRTIKMK